MKLIKDKNLLRNAAHFIDLMNTMGGGVCQTQVRLDKLKKGAVLKVAAPTVAPEAFNIALDKNKLTVFAALNSEGNNQLRAPLFHQEFILPAHIALDKIKAVYEGNELQVRLPYYETGTRQIDIEME